MLTATEPDHLPGGCERAEVALRQGEAIAAPAGERPSADAARRVSARGARLARSAPRSARRALAPSR